MTTNRPVSLLEFDIPGMGIVTDSSNPRPHEEQADSEEDLLFKRMFAAEPRPTMPRPHRPSPAARFALKNTPFRG